MQSTQETLQPAAITFGPQPIIRATKLSKSFQMGDSTVQVLKDVDFTLNAGEFIAIEGRSGSGKSTLLHILGALDSVDSGAVEFWGRPYARHVREDIGWFARLALSAWSMPIVFLLAFLEAGMVVQWAFQPRPGWRLSIALISAAILGTMISVPPGRWPRLRAGLIVFSAVTLAAGLGMAAHAGAASLFWMWWVFPGLAVIILVTRWLTIAALAFRRLPEDRKAAELRNHKFGFVFQFYYLLPELNVLENTILSSMIEHSWFSFLANKKRLRDRAIVLLTEFGLDHRLTHRPNQLSGGERQRVAIARALMNEPKVLFADEPTGNLDAETGRQIMAVLERLHRERGQTIVMVTHDRTLARKTDRVLVLKGGKLEPAEG